MVQKSPIFGNISVIMCFSRLSTSSMLEIMVSRVLVDSYVYLLVSTIADNSRLEMGRRWLLR